MGGYRSALVRPSSLEGAPMNTTMCITCIIVTRNPIHCHELITQLHRYGHPVIVVHPASTPAPPDAISITTPSLVSPAVARNLGAMQVTSDLLCFVDDDVRVDGDVPHILAHVFVAPHIVACGAVLVDHPHNTYWQRALHRMAFAPQYHQHAQRIPPLLASMMIVVRRITFNQVGGFDTTFHTPAGEDADLALKLRSHGTLMTLPQARITHHPHPTDWLSITRRCWRYGVCWPRIRLRHPSHMRPFPFPAPVTALALICGAPLFALYDTLRAWRAGHWIGYWWLRTWWYVGVAWGMHHAHD